MSKRTAEDRGRTTEDGAPVLPAPAFSAVDVLSSIRPLSSVLCPLSSVLCPLNASRFSDARLQAVSSRNMYSEHGFDARMGPEAGHVCQSLMVEWNCRPGSAEAHAAYPIFSHSSRAFTVLAGLPGG